MHFTLKSYIYGIVIYNEGIWSSLYKQYLKVLKAARYNIYDSYFVGI